MAFVPSSRSVRLFLHHQLPIWLPKQLSQGQCWPALLFTLFLTAILILSPSSVSAATPAFVQGNSADPQSAQASVSVVFTAAQTAGNLNVVIVGWNDSTSLVQSVTDSKGNAYALAVGPTVQSGVASQATYYAKNIAAAAAGSNSVIVTFNIAAAFPDIRIAEYSGLDAVNPLDVAVGAQGNTSSSSSGSVTTTNANDLLVAANTIQTITTGPGASFTNRIITNPDGDILEDRVVTVTGSYSGTAPVAPSGQWIMQMVAFRAAGGVPPPSITSLNPTSGPAGTSVTITGTNFGATQGASSVKFNGTVASPTNWLATSITVPVPAGASTGNVVVTVGGVASNGVSFTVLVAPSITSLNPTSGPVATSVTITGTNFGATQGPSSVSFSGTAATPTAWNATSITVPVPAGAATGNVVVTVSGLPSNGVPFTVTTAPSIISLNPTSGPVTTSVTITGANFGATQGSSSVAFNGTAATPSGWSATSITVPVPAAATTGNVVVTVGGIASNGVAFTVLVAPGVTSLNPTSGPVATSVTITGTNFGATQGSSSVSFSGTAATPTAWSATSITVPVPTGAATGNVVVTVSGLPSNGVPFTVTTAPSIISLNPTSGPVATSVTIAGANFGATQGTSTVTFNGSFATPTNWTTTSIIVPVPAGATTGNVVVAVAGIASNGVSFTVLPTPAISSLNPTSGQVGTSVTINGTNFGATQGTSSVTFNGIAAAVTAWSTSAITATVPTAGSGNVVVTVSGVASSGVSFTVLPPGITTLNPTSGPVGTPVTIAGSGFGNTPASSTVTFNGTLALPTSWSSSSIVVPVPAGATAGNVIVTVAGQPSNTAVFTVTAPPAGIKLLQHTSKDAGTTTSSTLAFASNNAAGNWIAVCIRAGSTGQVFTVADSRGNTYRKAVQLNETVDSVSLAIYYAENVAAGANTVTVSDTISGTLRFAILEYSGVATSSSFDVGAAAQGHSAAPSSGNATTTANGDLLLGAIFTGNPNTFTAGTGYTIEERVPAAPNSKLASQDQIQSAAGSVSSSATLGTADDWGAVLAAFKPAAGSGGTSPVISSLNPTSGPTSTSVTISGTNFGTTQGTSTVTFNGTAATPTMWTATSIIVPVPSSATTGNVVVTVGGVASNGLTFTVTGPPPSISGLNPTSGPFATPVTISGANFGSTQGTSTVVFNSTPASPTSWSASSITVPVPNGATTGSVAVSVAGVSSNGVIFTVTSTGPSISILSLTSGPVGAGITITGTGFGATQGASTVTFNLTAATATAWSDTSITVNVPAGATTGNVVVTVGGIASNGSPFTVTPPPVITSLNPTLGPIGTVVTISGTNFGNTVGTRNSQVLFNGVSARTNSYADTLITAPVPAGATTGPVVVSLSGVNSNGMNFTVAAGPNIANLNPTFGAAGTSVTITGTGFGATQGTSSVAFNGSATTPATWSDTSISVPVPAGATSGNVIVTVGGFPSNGVVFTVTSPAQLAFVQVNSAVPHPSATTVTIPYSLAQTAGNLNIVAVGWNDSITTVSSVTDSKGNVYSLAVAPTVQSGIASQAIYICPNILSGANSVTVTFSGSANAPDIRIAEYSGVDRSNPVDTFAAAQGNSGVSDSGPLATANSNDLIVGANLVATTTTGAGSNFTSRVITNPDGDILEDRIVNATGTFHATAPVVPSGAWIMQGIAFRAAGSAPPPPITVSVSPNTSSVASGYGTQAFTAQLTNDSQNKGVTWSLSGAGCSGSTCGSLSQVTSTLATYTAPPNIPAPATVTVTATAVADNTKTGTAAITVIQGSLAVIVNPKRGSITTSQTQQFTGAVFNDPQNGGVTWQVDGNTGGNTTTGTISTSGLFIPGTQPGLHTITATSVSNASVNNSVSFAVTDLQGVFLHHYDTARTGQNLKEYALTPANVNAATFTQMFSCPVDGYVYSQPLYVANLLVGSTTRNVLFVTTAHDSVYAFDADSPSCLQLWTVSLLGTGVTTMPWQDTANPSIGTPATDDVFPEIGITSTPVIDPATSTIYLTAKTKETVGSGCSSGNPCYFTRLHALSLTTGAEKFGGPVAISAPNFVPLRHMNRSGLLLANGTIYIGFGSHGDVSPWYGWLFGYDPATLARKFVFSTSDPTAGSNGASLWGGGAGPAVDANGNVYVSTGNGSYDGSKNFSESALKISPTGTLLDWFTPFNRSTFDANDIDLGSAGMIILPDSVGSAAHPHLAIATGKVAILYLLDQNNMGRFSSVSNNDVQEVIPVPPPNTTQLDGGLFGDPAYWNGNIYTTGVNYPLSQFKIANGVISTPAFSVTPNMFPLRGATPAVSASGTTNGILWVLDLGGWPTNGNAILYAYDATDVSKVLFTSPGSGAGASGPAVKFSVPTVANGKVYIGGQSVFTVFGLLPN